MSIVGNLHSQGIIQEYQKGLYYIDINKNKKMDAGEQKIPDDNQNGKTDLKEVLEFVVNNVEHMPTIVALKEAIINDKETCPEILNKVKNEYLPKIEAKCAETSKIETIKILKKYLLLNQKYHTAIEYFDDAEAIKIKKDLDALGEYQELEGGACFVFDKPQLVYLPGGESGLAKKIWINNIINNSSEQTFDITITGAEFSEPSLKYLAGTEPINIKKILYNKGYTDGSPVYWEKSTLLVNTNILDCELTLAKDTTIYGLQFKTGTTLTLSPYSENSFFISWKEEDQEFYISIDLSPNGHLQSLSSSDEKYSWCIIGFKTNKIYYSADGKTIETIIVKEPVERTLRNGQKVKGTFIHFNKQNELENIDDGNPVRVEGFKIKIVD